MIYEKTGHYGMKTSIFQATYNSSEFMDSYHGVYTATFAWMHHLEIYRFYKEDFVLKYLSRLDGGSLIDLGSGSGIWSLLALKFSENLSSQAVDISKSSVQRAQKMALASEFSTRTKFSVGDATIYSSTNKFDAGICCLFRTP